VDVQVAFHMSEWSQKKFNNLLRNVEQIVTFVCYL
jgi:hypothetical protein